MLELGRSEDEEREICAAAEEHKDCEERGRKADDTVCDAINAIEDAMSELARAKAKLEELE